MKEKHSGGLRILLTGRDGQVGRELSRSLAKLGEVTATGREELDLTSDYAIGDMVHEVRPQLIVNAAAYTAVDKAESDRERCFAVNAATPTVIAAEAAALGAKLVHYSTDYVFDGDHATPYVEEDPTGPRNVYGASKLAGERGIAEAGGEFLILRTSWVYSNHGANFLKTMLRLGAERTELRIVADQRGAPTSAEAIAGATLRILKLSGEAGWTSGLFHMTAAGATTWYGFAKAIFARAAGPKPSLVPIATAEYPTPAARPANSILSNDKFARTFGFQLPDWEQQLDAVMGTQAIAG